jgi:HD-like signal output (HDOD) protein
MFWQIFKKNKPKGEQLTNGEARRNVEQPQSVASSNSPVRVKANVSVAFIKRLMPIAQLLVEEEIEQLVITSADFAPGAVIFNPDTPEDALVYLHKGTVFLEAANGVGQEVNAETLKAFYPLSLGSSHGLTAIAKVPSSVIYVPKSVLKINRTNKLIIPDYLKKNAFLQGFYRHFQQGELEVPSFPDVALKMRRAIQQDLGVDEISKIINFDPALAGKLIQVVNSPLYRTATPISNCLNAVNRLGLSTTRNLVTAMSLKNLVSSDKQNIKKRIHEAWMNSVKVSSISYVLAKLTRKADPEEALLAGLLHNIGALPILMYAANLPENAWQPAELEACINELQGQVGAFILDKWEFPEELKKIPMVSANWFGNTGGQLNLADIVLLAKFHHVLALPSKPSLPLLNTLPAFHKMSDQPLTPELSLNILQEAKQQINETMSLFAA